MVIKPRQVLMIKGLEALRKLWVGKAWIDPEESAARDILEQVLRELGKYKVRRKNGTDK